MKAYRDPAFLEGDDARGLRILSEYLTPLAGNPRGRQSGLHGICAGLNQAP